MLIFRLVLVAALAAAFAGAGSAFAVADPPPWAHNRLRLESGPPAGRPQTVVSGTVIGVDYRSASLLVATVHGPVQVAVTPSTSIFHGTGYASFSDIGRGAHVDIDVAAVEGRLIAQIIRIR